MNNFIRAYLECILWAELDESTPTGGLPLEDNYGVEDFAPEALCRIVEDCKRFQEENRADLDQYNHPQYTADELGGHDFWLTRNGHGCGFWDRDCLPEDVGKRLTQAAERAGECNVYVGDDGLIYLV